MISKDELLKLVGTLKEQGVLNEEESTQYTNLAQSDDVNEVSGRLYLLLDEKIAAVDGELLETTSQLITVAKKMAEDSGEQAVLDEVNKLDTEFADTLQILDGEAEEIQGEYDEVYPILKEAIQITKETDEK